MVFFDKQFLKWIEAIDVLLPGPHFYWIYLWLIKLSSFISLLQLISFVHIMLFILSVEEQVKRVCSSL